MAGLDTQSQLGRQLLGLVGELVGFPRHLGQHVGGMVMTQGLLCELSPIENAAMPGRTVIEWDKDDLDELGILKVDCLALGMLSAIRKCFGLVREHHGRELTLANIPEGDQDVYAMISRADTLGVFQIESRAQMSMLPRLRPKEFYDLVIEVAIVRPGPIQGDMVHPYLRRRCGEEEVTYPSEEIRGVLEKTLARLWRVWLPRKPRRQLCLAGLCLVLAEIPLPGGVLRRADQQPADGLLCPRPTGPRCARARRRDSPSGRQPQPLGLHAGREHGWHWRPASVPTVKPDQLK
jgi:hypothetical protein